MNKHIVTPPGYGSNIYVNNGDTNNNVTVTGTNTGNIVTGTNHYIVNVSNNGSIDWEGLQSDLNSLYQKVSRINDDTLRVDVCDTADELQNAVKNKDESAVRSTLKRAATGTLDFIKALSLQVLPSLILKKYG